MKLKCIVVDDEPLALDLMSSYVRNREDLQLVEVCHNAYEAKAALQQYQPDLMFLDIQMPGMTGFELLAKIENPPAVIITTAYRDYAYEGYEFNVVDFLLKPIFYERFEKAVEKVFLRKGLKTNETIAEGDANASFDQAYMYFKVDREMVKVYLKDILWVESMKDYVKIKLVNQGQLVTYQRISYLEEKLPEDIFVRVHRSFIVNLKHITAFNTVGVSIQQKTLPIGRLYKSQVLLHLQQQLESKI